MKRIKITTPENIEVEYTLADIGSRSAAVIIDSLIQGVAFLIIAIANIMIAKASPEFWRLSYGWIIGADIILYFVISFGYFIIMELTMNGMTIGKKLFKIRAIRNNGQPLTLKHSALRNIFRILIDMLGVGVILMFFNKEHKRVGDLVASTIVIIEEEKEQPVSLDELIKNNERYRYYISDEEHELLKSYFERKNKMEDCSVLTYELKKYFVKKFEAEGVLKECEELLNRI